MERSKVGVRGGVPRRGRRLTGAALATVALSALTTVVPNGVTTPTAQAASTVSLVPVRQVGQPGHAGLYGWGVAYDPTDDTVLVGDYWNFRVARFNLDGTSAGPDPVTTANKGSANNENPDPLLHQSPYGLAVDPVSGDFFMGDVDGGKTVDKYTHDGGDAILAFGGNGTGVGKFQYPSRVAINPEDHTVFVVDQWQHLISVHDPDTGAELRSFGGNGTALGQLRQPRGTAFAYDAQNRLRLFVADNYNSRIQVFDPATGQGLYTFGGKGTNPGQYGVSPDLRGLAVDQANGWVYVADAASGYVNKYTLDGRYLSRFGGYADGPTQFVGGPREVAVDGDGNVWVGDMPGFRVLKVDPDGNLLLDLPTPAQQPADGGFNQPRGVAVDGQGNVFVSDTHNFRMQKFHADGTFDRSWGHRGGTGLGFNYHRGVAVDRRNGDVVVADTDNHKIVKFTNDGDVVWEVGGFGTALGQFKNPHSLTVGPDGTVYVADTQNQRVVVLSENGTALRTFGSKGSADGQFQFPRSVTVDPADGSLWVSDSVRGVVQHFTNGGQFLGRFGSLGTGAGKLQRAADVEVMGDYVLVADVDEHQIKIWTKAGAFVTAQGGGGRNLGQLLNPHGMDVAPDGTLWVVEQTGERVQQFQLVVSAADSQAPTVAITAPAAASTQPLAPVTLTGSATDNIGVASAEVTVRNTATGSYLRSDGTWGAQQWLPVPVQSPGATSTAFSYVFDPPAEGSYAFQARSVDTANLRSTAVSRSFKVSADSVPPTVTPTTPGANATVPGPTVTVGGTASDNVAVASVAVAVKQVATGRYLQADGSWGPAFVYRNATVTGQGTPSASWSSSFSAPAPGKYSFQSRSTDTAGLVSTIKPTRAFTVS